jgi:hypothetical protein
VPIEAVALKLFTGIENFEIMAIPFFILSGNFLTLEIGMPVSIRAMSSPKMIAPFIAPLLRCARPPRRCSPGSRTSRSWRSRSSSCRATSSPMAASPGG